MISLDRLPRLALLLLLLIEKASSRRSPSTPAEDGDAVLGLLREKKGNFFRCRLSLLLRDGWLLSALVVVVVFMLFVADADAVS